MATLIGQSVQEAKRVAASRFVLDLLTHEQYFWPFYQAYLPDHAERLDRAIGLLTEHGYQSVFLQDGFLGGPESTK